MEKEEEIINFFALEEPFLNDLQARLHENDMLVKNIQSSKKLLDQNAVNVFKNFIKYVLKEKEMECMEYTDLVKMPQCMVKNIRKKQKER